MEFSHSILGCYISKPINLKQFKTENAYTVDQIKMSKITDRIIFEKLRSINPSADLSHLPDDIKMWETELQNYNYQEVFDSPDTLSARYIFPIYGTIRSNLQTLKVMKSDFYQTKKTKLYTPLPSFTPRGNITPGQTLLITISIYYPFHWTRNQIPDEAVFPRCKKTLQFYDAQTLQDLKQGFKCENEETEISGDISKTPHKPLEYIVNSDLKHGLFYINNNLYVDTLPDKSTKIYAETMKKWACDNGKPIENILSLDTQLLDLEICIGQPYVYQHLGRCEHLFIFNEISIAKSNDCLGQTNYPRVISVAKEKLKNCIFCSKNVASVVMLNDDERTPVSVNHMCEPCFKSYNYDHLDDKVSNFKAYRCIKWKK
ncbi:snRNA-activating protein complex subunit 3 isoform X1 [Rhopalosiphum padi]|uniref:snRNA-activating protein complex subunit 3 isoform X1 n=1 Tax=Rhopalosiphum padi TaxID=40932 RepID=UPI00298E6F1C|nr:snRNA-activating protein complex subunit 3 isoform X1 [Rhopalosiphum padi]XP_060836891.1 snRNA-activating protein complex subunit 3 isoform X1 [Rhopalosiphum padi]XP_060836892.1 snRNA-activating protein complex subunit 3 isoform X1 [Rhopalosiphum padi]